MTEPITAPPIANVGQVVNAPASAPTAQPAPVPVADAPKPLEPLPPVSTSKEVLNVAGTGGASVGGYKVLDEDFGKPLLFHILKLEYHTSQFESEPFVAPTVDYIVLDPATGKFEERKNVIVTGPKLIRAELVEMAQKSAYHSAVAGLKNTGKPNPAKVLQLLNDTNGGGYTAEQANEHLINAAKSLGWDVGGA